jgi:signal transduction histidine kinase
LVLALAVLFGGVSDSVHAQGALRGMGAVAATAGGLGVHPVFGLLVGALFLRRLIRPIEALSAGAARVAAGDLDVGEVETDIGDELGALARAWNAMTAALRSQQRKLQVQHEQLLAQEKLASVGRLAAGVAHEVGNPLTAVLGYVDILVADAKDPGTRDLLLRVQGETGRIHRIVHDLLDYARPVPESREPVSLRELGLQAVELVSTQPRFREITVDNAIPAELPPASASHRRLLQVMLNLLLNAADAQQGRGHVHLAAQEVREGTQRWLALEVTDDGPGVPIGDRDHIFDPFFTTKEPGAGTGLGLAVCRSIIAAQGGTIALSPCDRGARFRLTLPIYEI